MKNKEIINVKINIIFINLVRVTCILLFGYLLTLYKENPPFVILVLSFLIITFFYSSVKQIIVDDNLISIYNLRLIPFFSTNTKIKIDDINEIEYIGSNFLLDFLPYYSMNSKLIIKLSDGKIIREVTNGEKKSMLKIENYIRKKISQPIH